MVLPHLWMHRTGPDRSGGCRGGGGRDPVQIFVRITDEFGAAARTAEVIVLPGVAGVVRGGGWIDRHAANRIVNGTGCGLPGDTGPFTVISVLVCLWHGRSLVGAQQQRIGLYARTSALFRQSAIQRTWPHLNEHDFNLAAARTARGALALSQFSAGQARVATFAPAFYADRYWVNNYNVYRLPNPGYGHR